MATKDIFECADHREYLKLHLGDPKAFRGPRALARKAGFKSPSHVTMLVRGDRSLTHRSAEMLAKALALKGRRKSLLLAFSRLDTAKTETERGLARNEIVRIKRSQPEFQLAAKQYSFLATWYYPVLLTLLHGPAARFDAITLAGVLGRGVSEADTERALEDLKELGLIDGASGNWAVKHAVLKTPEDVRHLAIAQYHRNVLGLAEKALALPLEERDFSGLTLTIPRRLVPEVKERIRAFRTELNERIAKETDAADVYQINFQMFPVTHGMEGKKS